jgi:hypothetical protein
MNEAINSAIAIALAQQREEIAKRIERLKIHEWEPSDERINQMVAIAAHTARETK